MMFKEKKVRSEKHRRYIASLPCLRCGREDVQAAHIRTGTGGGMGLKPCDSYTVPLCVNCHHQQHEIGEPRFWGNDLDKAKSLAKCLFDVSGDYENGRNLIKKFKSSCPSPASMIGIN